MGRFTIQVKDSDGDLAQTSVYVADATIGSEFEAALTDRTAFVNALDDIIGGAIIFHEYSPSRAEFEPANPSDPGIQANYQAVFEAVDDVTGAVFKVRFPTPDHDVFTLTVNGVKSVDLSAGVGLAMKAAWDDFVQSPEGNASSLQAVYLRE